MILLLQLLGIFVSGGLALMFVLLVIAPALGGVVHGRRFTINWWHALLAGVLVALAVWQAIVYGLIGAGV